MTPKLVFLISDIRENIRGIRVYKSLKSIKKSQ